jgi:hypothetical protein
MANKKKETSYYELILNSILEDIPEDATKVTKDIESDKTVDDKSTELKAREKIYTKLTEDFESNYEKTHNQKRNLKTAFFWIIMPLYAVIILGSMYVILKSLCMEGNNTDVVLGAVASIIALLNSNIGSSQPSKCAGNFLISLSRPTHKNERFALIWLISSCLFIAYMFLL